jgi:hypothetical protein
MSANRVILATSTDTNPTNAVYGQYSLDSTGDQVIQTALSLLGLPPGSRYPLLLRLANGKQQLVLPDSRLRDHGVLTNASLVLLVSGQAIPPESVPSSVSPE